MTQVVGIIIMYALVSTIWCFVAVLFIRRSMGITRMVHQALGAPTAEFEFDFGHLPRPDGDDKQCSICLDDFRKGERCRLLTACGHWFHARCVDPWLRSSATCPVCRTAVASNAAAAAENVQV